MKDYLILALLGYLFSLVAGPVTALVVGFHVVKFSDKIYKLATRAYGLFALVLLLQVVALSFVALCIDRDSSTPVGRMLFLSTAAVMPIALASAAFMRGLDEQRKANRVPGTVLAQQFREAYHAQLRAETQAKAAADAKANADSRAEAQAEVDAHLLA